MLIRTQPVQYTPGEEVTLWTNKVGPYHNPQETYDYYSLPFCKPDVSFEYFLQSSYLLTFTSLHYCFLLGVIVARWCFSVGKTLRIQEHPQQYLILYR